VHSVKPASDRPASDTLIHDGKSLTAPGHAFTGWPGAGKHEEPFAHRNAGTGVFPGQPDIMSADQRWTSRRSAEPRTRVHRRQLGMYMGALRKAGEFGGKDGVPRQRGAMPEQPAVAAFVRVQRMRIRCCTRSVIGQPMSGTPGTEVKMGIGERQDLRNDRRSHGKPHGEQSQPCNQPPLCRLSKHARPCLHPSMELTPGMIACPPISWRPWRLRQTVASNPRVTRRSGYALA
jgi:hypothetical protein